MPRVCELTGLGILAGNKVSHSNRKTRRKFCPNLQNITLSSEVLNRTIKLRIATSTLRTIDFKGGLDNFLLETKSNKLLPDAKVLRNKIKSTIAKSDKAEDAPKKARKVAVKPKKRLVKKLQAKEAKMASATSEVKASLSAKKAPAKTTKTTAKKAQ